MLRPLKGDPAEMRDPDKRTVLIEAVIASGLLAIGFASGQAPLLVLSAAATSIGCDWTASLAERGFQHWRSRWFTDDGVLNKDITRALCHAFEEAVRQVEHDWKRHHHYHYLQHKNPAEVQLTLDTLRILREAGTHFFQQHDQFEQIVQRDQVLNLLSQDEAKANDSLKQALDTYLFGHDEEFVTFVTKQLGPNWITRFLEILKGTNEEGTRAWRACQLLWQQSLMFAIDQIQRTTIETADTVRWLQTWAQELRSQPLTQRNPIGQNAIEEILRSLHAQLGEIQSATARIEKKLDETYAALEKVAPGQGRKIPFLAPPLPPYELVGRGPLLSHLKQRLLAGESLGLSALNGLPGVGKTALAVALIHDPEVLTHFDDGVLWAGLGPNADVLAHLGRWAIAVGISPEEIAQKMTLQERSYAIQEKIGMRSMLLVVDDAWQLEEALAFKVGGPRCAYLVTTRLPKVAQGFAGDGAVGIHELNEDQGLMLLKELAPMAVEAEPESARDLVQWVDGLPLALMLMGNYLRSETHDRQPRRLSTALGRLRQAKERLQLAWPQGPLEQHPSLPGGVSLSLMASIDVSYHALNRDARSMLLAFSPFPAKPNTFSEAAAVAVSALPARILDRLTDSGLVESSEPGRYALHLIISDYARLKCTRKTPYERMVAFFVSFVQEHKKDYMLLDQEASNVLISLHTAYERGLNNSLVQGITEFTPFLQSRGLYEIAELHLKRAEQAARSLGDSEALVKSLGALGRIAQARGMYLRAEEYLQEGLTLARQIGDAEAIISLLSIQGIVAQKRGDFAGAEKHYQEGLDLARQIGKLESISALLSNLGTLASSFGDFVRAEEYWQDALALARQPDSPEAIISLSFNLGSTALMRHDRAQAKKYLEEGLALAHQIGHLEYLSRFLLTLANLGMDADQEEKYLQEGLTLALQIGETEQIGFVLYSLGFVARKRRDFNQAEKYWQKGLALARQVGNLEQILSLLGALASLAQALGNLIEAERYYQEGLVLARQIGHPLYIRDMLTGLGGLARDRGDYTEAEEYSREAITLPRKLGNWTVEFLRSFSDLGEVEEQRGSYVQAETYYQEGLTLARESGVDLAIILYLIDLGLLEDEQGNYMQAESYYLELLALERKLGRSKGIEAALGRLGDLAKECGDYARAEGYFKECLALTRQLGTFNSIRGLLKDLGDIAQRRGDYIQAKGYYEEGLDLARQLEDPEDACKLLAVLGNLSLKQQQWGSAATAFQEAFTISQALKNSEMAAASLYGLAQIAVAQGNIAKAHEQGQASLRLFEAMHHELASEVRQWLAVLPKSINGEQGQKRLR